jgi:glycosyltransferase involved in cell wall biosynthesis
LLVSVVVRSFHRKAALLELVARLREQRYSHFEVVILEQSNDPALVKELESLGDARIRVVVNEPINPPAARNEAIRHSKGDVILLIDDDDLPIGDDWIAQHVKNYEDPDCMGVVGRLVTDPEHPAFPKSLAISPCASRSSRTRRPWRTTRCARKESTFSSDPMPRCVARFSIASAAGTRGFP